MTYPGPNGHFRTLENAEYLELAKIEAEDNKCFGDIVFQNYIYQNKAMISFDYFEKKSSFERMRNLVDLHDGGANLTKEFTSLER